MARRWPDSLALAGESFSELRVTQAPLPETHSDQAIHANTPCRTSAHWDGTGRPSLDEQEHPAAETAAPILRRGCNDGQLCDPSPSLHSPAPGRVRRLLFQARPREGILRLGARVCEHPLPHSAVLLTLCICSSTRRPRESCPRVPGSYGSARHSAG